MTIIYLDTLDFYDGIQMLVRYGLMFEANHNTLKITLTGGY